MPDSDERALALMAEMMQHYGDIDKEALAQMPLEQRTKIKIQLLNKKIPLKKQNKKVTQVIYLNLVM